MTPEEEFEGASVQEQLIEACRRNNTKLLGEILDGKSDDDIAHLLNDTTTVMGNHLYHEAASRGNYEIIDMLLDQPGFECDPVSRREGDTPLHSAVRWVNAEPPAQRAFGCELVEMMLEAGSSARVRNKGGLTPLQLVDPRNEQLREVIRRHEYAALNAGDFVGPAEVASAVNGFKGSGGSKKKQPDLPVAGSGGADDNDDDDDDDDDAEFSGSDEEERAEWERRRAKR